MAQGGEGKLTINKYEGGVGEELSGVILDFDYNHSAGKDSVGIIQLVVVDTFRTDIEAPYQDPAPNSYYDDYIDLVPRPDPTDKLYNFDTQSYVPGSKLVPSREAGILRFNDFPRNPTSTNQYGVLMMETRIVRRSDNSTIKTIHWGYSNTASGFTLFPLGIE